MNLHLTSSTLGTHKQSRKPLIVAACGALLTLAVATGIGAWQITERGGNEMAAVITQPAPTAGAADRFDAMGGVAEQLRQQSLSVSAPAAARLDHMGGVAEQLREHAAAGAGAAGRIDSMGGVAEQLRDQQAQTVAASARWDTIGGVAEQMRDAAN